MSSIISPTSCGFAKVAAYNIFNGKDRLNTVNTQLELFNKQFTTCEENFCVESDTFRKNFPKILDNFKSLQKRRSADKENVLKVFSMKKWNELPSDVKAEHKLFDCNGCLKNPQLKEALGCFFVNEKYKKLAEEKGIIRMAAIKVKNIPNTAKVNKAIAVESVKGI